VLLTSLFASLLLASTTGGAFLDTVGHPYAPEIAVLRERGIVEGYTGNLFRPDIPINRAEYLKILMFAVNGNNQTAASPRCFSDFTGTPAWYWLPACAAKDAGVVDGYPDGTFRGGSTINFAEAVKMAVGAWNIPVAERSVGDAWFDPYFAAIADTDVPSNYGYDAGYLLTRADVAWIFVHLGRPLANLNANASSQISAPSEGAPTAGTQSSITTAIRSSLASSQASSPRVIDPHSVASIASIPHGSLLIETQPFPGTGGDIPIALFTATAEGQDVYFTGAKFSAASGTLANAADIRLVQYSEDGKSPEVTVATGTAKGDKLTFTSHALVAVGHPRLFGVLANLRAGSARVTLTFDTSDPQFLDATGAVDGRQLTGIRIDGAACGGFNNCWIELKSK